ncbi:telomere-associated protein Tap [Streptomyces youssoufiensis]
MSTENELFSAVDALLEQVAQDDLPAPAERKRLREAAGLSQAQIAKALDARREAVGNWEAGRTEPRPPKRAAYARLLEGLAQRFPASAADAPATAAAPAVPKTFASPAPAPASASAPAPAAAPPARPRPVASSTAGPVQSSRRPGAKKAAAKKTTASAAAVDPRFENGPLAVIDVDADGQVSAYCVGGLVLDVPAKTIPALVDWTLAEAKLGQARLHRNGRDADPILVLTASALERYGLPAALSEEERHASRLPAGHKVVKQIERAGLQMTQRGLGPWARLYRDPEGSRRRCVQLCILPWNALNTREWGRKDDPELLLTMHPADLARYLGLYAARVMTPRGSTATTGLELMTALRPPTRAEKDSATGEFKRAFNDDALTQLYPVVECEVPDEHPILKGRFARHHMRTPAEMLMEEPYDWCRPLTDEECANRYLVAVDLNMSFAAAANGLTVGLNGPTHLTNPRFDASLPGSWLVDLSHVDLARVRINGRTVDGDRLPSPFTPTGERPTGPAWYATPTVAYAVELGFDVAPIEAYVRTQTGRYLDSWYKRLRDAYVETMADMGVTTDLQGEEFLEAMAGRKQTDPTMALLETAIKATAKGAIGKLRQRSRGQVPYYEPYPALERVNWRPDIRAAVLANQRTGLHRKLMKTAAAADLYPTSIGTDAIVYPSPGPSPLDVLPATPEGKPVPGGFRLGVSPGMVKHQGTQTVLWAEQLFEERGGVFNISNLIKTADPTAGEGE